MQSKYSPRSNVVGDDSDPSKPSKSSGDSDSNQANVDEVRPKPQPKLKQSYSPRPQKAA